MRTGLKLFLFLLITTLVFAADRTKTDILLVVAHPDDDTLVSSYLARAIFDQNKRVAVVYCTRGDSGSNSDGRERARALGTVREIEGRRSMAVLGITNVWYLDGRDTASQNVLVSLGSWPHGSVLEQLVRIMRVTRPEIVMTWLPSSVAGENHGDHQAAGVVATEAFDLAGSPVVFPAQVAAPVRKYENALDGLRPWQPKKLYYFTDAFEPDFMQGKGPEYSGKDISPSKKVPYLQIAIQSTGPYYTQSPDPKLNEQIENGENLVAIMQTLGGGGEDAFFPDPVRLLLGKSHVKNSVTADIFEGVGAGAIEYRPPQMAPIAKSSGVSVELAGPWGFYRDFWHAHDLRALDFRRAEIPVNPSDKLTIPLLLANNSAEAKDVSMSVVLPAGWKLNETPSRWTVIPGDQTTVSVSAMAPGQIDKMFKEIQVTARSEGKTVGTASVFVQIRTNVAAQLK